VIALGLLINHWHSVARMALPRADATFFFSLVFWSLDWELKKISLVCFNETPASGGVLLPLSLRYLDFMLL